MKFLKRRIVIFKSTKIIYENLINIDSYLLRYIGCEKLLKVFSIIYICQFYDKKSEFPQRLPAEATFRDCLAALDIRIRSTQCCFLC